MGSLKRFLNYDLGILILRIGFGLGFFVFHGLAKIMDGPERWASLGKVMSKIGIDYGHSFFGFMAALAESVGGIFIAIGFQMQVSAILLASTMLMASIQHIFGSGSPANAIKYFFTSVSLIFLDPGKYSLDHYLSKKQ